MSRAALLAGAARALTRLTGAGPRPPLDLTRVRRALVVRLDGIGDLVLSTPFLRLLRRGLPGARITALVDPRAAPLLACCPHVDEVLTYDSSGGRVAREVKGVTLAVTRLARPRFDLALLPRWESDFWRGTTPAYVCGARRRVGHALARSRRDAWPHVLRAGLLTDTIEGPPVAHEVERGLGLLRGLGIPIDERDRQLELWTTGRDDARAAELLLAAGVAPDEPLVALAPGAISPRRRWPRDAYAEVARGLHERRGLRAVLIGGPDDVPLHRALAGAPWLALDATGALTLPETVALLRRARLYVGADTGPMHMAVAVGVPVVELSCHPRTGSAGHLNSPARYGPWAGRAAVLQPAAPRPPCVDGCDAAAPHCILTITVDEVRRAAEALLDGGGP